MNGKLTVSPKIFLVDILLAPMMFATGSFLRLLLGKEVAEIDSMKMSEHVLTRLHSFGGKKKCDSTWKDSTTKPKIRHETELPSSSSSGSVTDSQRDCGQPNFHQDQSFRTKFSPVPKNVAVSICGSIRFWASLA